MKKIFNFFQRYMDKIAHMGMGTYIGFIVAYVVGLFCEDWFPPVWAALAVVGILAWRKEVTDGENNAYDWLASIIGCILGCLMWYF